MINRIIKGLIFTILIIVSGGACTAQNSAGISSAELKNHVQYLASQDLAGRYPGTNGDVSAAIYIRDCYRKYGLNLFPDDGFQSFQVTTGIKKGSNNFLTINGQVANSDSDFSPIPISENGKVESTLVFLGYGFRIKDDNLTWDDYEGVNARGKVAIILLGAPEPQSASEIDPFEEYGSIRLKLLNARDAGVSAVIFVAGPSYDEKDEIDFGTIKENSAGLPVIRAKRLFINQVLAEKGINIENLESNLNHFQKPTSSAFDIKVSLQADVVTQTATTQNVVGWIQAPDTGAIQEWVVVGAHFDHLGMGGMGSNSRVQDTVGVHPGADDNASGVSAMIEMAGYLASIKDQLKRSVLFVAFTGEEMGLLGSKFFVANSPFPIRRISAMINLDMVGRPNEEKKLSIGGTGTAMEIDSILNQVKPGSLVWGKSPEGFGPSDHASFYTADIPVLYFSTGAHLDYHTPADTPDKLDYNAMSEISSLVSEVVLLIATSPSQLTFVKSGQKASDSGRRKLKVTLGIMPDVSGAENNGLRVEFATPGKPAQLAGITKGDRIVAINGLPVTNVYDYMTRLQTLKPGQTVSVELVRGDKTVLILVQL
jgi:aminopeptidase YwaD